MKDYFVYLPDQALPGIWGCVATSLGFTRVLPGSAYPAQRHPVDHHFNWARGRILQRYQIILIAEGRGTFQSAAAPDTETVDTGSVLILFPGVWHRYMPDSETGWVEHWIECQGPAFDEAVKKGLIEPHRALLRSGANVALRDCFERCHKLAREGALANQDLLSTLGLHMLAIVVHCHRGANGPERAIDEVVERAQSLIALRCQERLDLPGLSAELGLSYSHLRHSFRSRLGISLKQHYLNTRLQKAQDLLANTVHPIKVIANILGFESPFHLSNQFKHRFGISPRAWRNRNQTPRRQEKAPPTNSVRHNRSRKTVG
jgi:AraC-like DNA-binding protein